MDPGCPNENPKNKPSRRKRTRSIIIIPNLISQPSLNQQSGLTMFPNPSSFAKGDKTDLPEVDQLGTVSLEKLHEFDCNNPDRRILSLFGILFDVTSSEKGYGKDGAYKEYAGRDITLAIGLMKTDEQWLDRFVSMEEKWITDAKGWVDYMESKYPKCGKLDKWDEDQAAWPELTEEEREAINKCVIM